MSYHLLNNPFKMHTLQDDLESFFHVEMYLALLYSKHSESGPHGKLLSIIRRIYDSAFYDDDGYYKGGGEKANLIQNPKSTLGRDFQFTSKPLNKWWRSCAKVIAE